MLNVWTDMTPKRNDSVTTYKFDTSKRENQSQYWKIQAGEDETYFIYGGDTKFRLGPVFNRGAAQAKDGNKARLDREEAGGRQEWLIESEGGGKYVIRPAGDHSLALTATGNGRGKNEVTVQVYDPKNDMQHWVLAPK